MMLRQASNGKGDDRLRDIFIFGKDYDLEDRWHVDALFVICLLIIEWASDRQVIRAPSGQLDQRMRSS